MRGVQLGAEAEFVSRPDCEGLVPSNQMYCRRTDLERGRDRSTPSRPRLTSDQRPDVAGQARRGIQSVTASCKVASLPIGLELSKDTGLRPSTVEAESRGASEAAS